MINEIKRRVEFIGCDVKGIVKMTDVSYHVWNDNQSLYIVTVQRGGLNVSRETCIKKEDGTYALYKSKSN